MIEASGSVWGPELNALLATHYTAISNALKMHQVRAEGHGAGPVVKPRYAPDGSLVHDTIWSRDLVGGGGTKHDRASWTSGDPMQQYGRLTERHHTPEWVPAMGVHRITGTSFPQWSLPSRDHSKPKWT